MKNIRNFAIIAHVDHGKSTLADRFLELTEVVKAGQHEEQFLDRNPISRERGITIKLAPVRMEFRIQNLELRIEEKKILNSEFYILNLIDTPGHVDFSYEVDRTLACVEGVILLVDATAGIQAQTISNLYKALEKKLVIIPAVNKIDLANAEVKKTKEQLANFLGIDPETSSGQVFEVSAKTGEGVEKLLKAVIKRIPPPHQERLAEASKDFFSSSPNNVTMKQFNNEVFALIFDSYYDSHRGVIAFVRIFSGQVKKGDKVKLVVANEIFTVQEVGYFTPDLKPSEKLVNGEIGYLVTNLKDIHKVKVGDTIASLSVSQPLAGYKKIKPMVFASVFPTDTNDYLNLKKALEKLYLTDSSLEFKPVHSRALGAGFRVGFLGLLHADVVRERLEREFNLSLVLTPPQVEYEVQIENNLKGSKLKFKEPFVRLLIIVPAEYLGKVMQLCQDYRGKFVTMDSIGREGVSLQLIYEMPMSELMTDFYDNLKSVSSGYASLDWQFSEYRSVIADKLEILLNQEPVEEFSEIVSQEKAFPKGQFLVKRLREVIPRQQYEVRIQARFMGKIIASERIAPFRKDVTQKLYGGDRTRKDKLLEKQKEGKKRMKMIGKVEIPKEAFMKLFNK